jgi:hypothetical protein
MINVIASIQTKKDQLSAPHMLEYKKKTKDLVDKMYVKVQEVVFYGLLQGERVAR